MNCKADSETQMVKNNSSTFDSVWMKCISTKMMGFNKEENQMYGHPRYLFLLFGTISLDLEEGLLGIE